MSNVFTIVVVSWRNLQFLQLLIKSIKNNSCWDHEIVVHLNEAQEYEREWVLGEGLKLTESETNIGLSRAANLAADKGTAQWICPVDDDMYVLPRWDERLLDCFNRHQGRIWVSSTMIEPEGPSTSIIRDFGRSPDTFQEAQLLSFNAGLNCQSWYTNSATPVLFERSQWDKIGGYDEHFPNVGAELGLAKRCWDILGFRHFISDSESRVYHFRSISMARLSSGNEGPSNRDQKFVSKYKIKAGKFRAQMRKNQLFQGAIE